MNFLDKYQNKILIGIWSAIFLTCLFVIFTEPVKAASQDSTDLPYVVENVIPEDISFFEDLFKTTATNWGYNSDMIYRGNWESDNLLAYYYVNDGGAAYMQIFIPYNNSPSYSISLSKQYGLFDSDTDYIDLTLVNYQHIQYRSNNGSPWYYDNIWEGNHTLRLLGGNIIPDYISGNFYDSSDNLVLTIASNDVVVDSGHASEPVDDHGHYIEDGNGNRIPKPNKPTPSVYTPPTIQFPSVDTSSLEKLVESLIDLVQYGISYIGGVISGWFSNLLSNLDSWFDYVVSSFNYAINNVVGAIKDLAQTFYNNMVSLFEPFYEFLSGVASFFNHLIQIGTVDGAFDLANIVTYLFLPDSSAIYPIFVSHDEFNIIGITNHLFDEYRLFMSRVESINTLHYIMIPSFTFHNQVIPQTRIDFSWFEDYKVYTDGVISAFLIVGYVYFLFTRISGWLRGNQGDVYVGDNSSNYHGTKIGF